MSMVPAQFPFHAGELDHQYHNDFKGEPYGKKYNALRGSRAAEGALQVSKCPGDKGFVGSLASGDFGSLGLFNDKSVNN